MFVWLGITLIGHAAFVVEDAAGLFCHKTPSARELKDKEKVQFTFTPNQFCVGSGFILNEGVNYRITVKRTGSDAWRDGEIDTTLGGFRITELHFWRRFAFIAALPLKRDLIRPWFRVILRVGTTGTYEDFLDPDPNQKNDDTLQERFMPLAAGELFVYVNDVALPIPSIHDFLYRNNSGRAVVTVEWL
jgi:hypothetical protein